MHLYANSYYKAVQKYSAVLTVLNHVISWWNVFLPNRGSLEVLDVKFSQIVNLAHFCTWLITKGGGFSFVI